MRNPIIFADYPDLDVIRVGDTYYMVTTTMHVFPGGEILRSRDLHHWEHCAYVYDALGETPGQRLDDGKGIYGQGMWAGSLRYHAGLFHLVFMCNDTHSAYHFTAEDPEGPWARHPMAGFYHDPSVLFDEDGRVYIVYGNREIRLTELLPDLSAPKPGGLDRIILRDDCNGLGWEGSHLYKHDGKYLLFVIHWSQGSPRAEGCFIANSLEDEFTGGEIICQPFDGRPDGPAQGGMVDTPDGRWYLMVFQDHGAVGRIPVLAPMTWQDGFPHVEPIPAQLPDLPATTRPLMASDPLRGPLDIAWQWNHEPHWALIRQDASSLTLTTDRVTDTVEHAINTLTQRTFGPRCTAQVTLDGAHLRPGDKAGLCALQGQWGQIALTRDKSGFRLEVLTRPGQQTSIPWSQPTATLRADFDFINDTVRFSYENDGWHPLGDAHPLVYKLDHFMGVRVGLFCYATEEPGGSATFSDFHYTAEPHP